MPGGLLQLSAFGSASTYLHADPQVTFWKQAWRRSTAFALESIEMPFQGGPGDFGRKTTAAITKSADMASRAWVELTLPDLSDYYHSVLSATSTQPLLVKGYFTSPTTAVVRVRPPTAGGPWTSIRVYSSTNTPLEEIVLPVGVLDIDVPLTGLTSKAALTVYAIAYDADDDPSDQSQPRDILALKWANSIGHAVIESAEWEIGGTRIDKIPNSEFFDVWSELTEKEEKLAGFHAMVGKYPDYDIWDDMASERARRTYYVPLVFSFCATPGQSIPIVALQFHEARINITFREAMECIRCNVPVAQLVSSTGAPIAFQDCRVFVDMAFLDTEERRAMSSMSHEALITQIQYLGDVVITPDDPGTVRRIPLDGLNHPIKELIWIYQPYPAYQRDAVGGNDLFNYSNTNAFDLVRLTLNGAERMTPRPGQYFRHVQPYQHHTRVPAKQVLCYNFGLEPESANPSGACNFSRLDQAALQLTVSPSIHPNGGKIKVWALGYNVVRYKEGLAGLAFTSG